MKWIFILVEPAVPENIGASARAMKTMGFNRLRLVNPCTFREGKAKWVAHASGEVLDGAEVYASLADAVSDVDFVIATSAKTRSVKGDHHPADGLSDLIRSKSESINSVAVVFGREESGLTNEEMQHCHISTFIPMATTYPSLNLSQAVMLYAYLLSSNQTESDEDEEVKKSKFKALNNRLEAYLKDTRIESNPNIYKRIFERVALLGDNDINLMMSVLAALDEKMAKE
jgi:tRNA/rRNA methyltransferase